MTYWWSLVPLWTLMLGFMLLTSFFQITAFQPPTKKGTTSLSSKVSVGVATLGEAAKDKTPTQENIMRCSGTSACSDEGAAMPA